ncbi:MULTISPECIES: tautomerase family protein [Enterobacterales]|uniref:tautomerase family protein n=1 Tax=Enterobacterales TaxID=91347 RepID=UPI000708BF5E|nr:tautomerase family protein [Salmonella enterica]ECH2854861.1 tautomerase family protein [Salmonella enterica]EGG4996884.1 tautomerase family protein [Salmonella enterica]HDY3220855.1 tautomerase family protein [Salmonella enterica]
MPFTRITLRQGYSDAEIAQISVILQQSLEEEFAVPPGDLFQVFEELPARLRVFDRYYKSDGRSDNFIQFHILAGKPRTNEQKQNLCRVLSQRLNNKLDICPDDVMVMIQFNTADEWSFSQGRMLPEEIL